MFVAGAAGMGKSTLAAWLRGQAAGRGWRTGHGMASAIEGAWPYAPVLEAIADLCRRHPTLLDGLDDRCRRGHRPGARRHDAWTGTATAPGSDSSWRSRNWPDSPPRALGFCSPIDDVQDADEASLRLLHYLARSCLTDRLILVLCHRRQPATDAFEQVRASLLGRNAAIDVSLAPLDRADVATLARSYRPELDEESLDQISEVSGGVPFAVVGLARAAGAPYVDGRSPGSVVLDMLAPAVRTALVPVATTGTTFDTDEFLSLCGLPEDEAYDCLDAALAALVIERTLSGYRFRHPLIRDALLEGLTPHRRRAMHRVCAERLAALDASPARIGHHLLAAGDPAAAVPHVLRAAETAAAIGAYRDALSLVDSIRAAADGAAGRRALALRADLLAAIGDPAAMSAYHQAIAAASPSGQRVLRARMARFAILSGDRATAAAVLDGLEPDGGPDDTAILIAKANVAYFTGDLDGAWANLSAASRGRCSAHAASTWTW